jgi:rhodanese-related sulfurtransferase
MPTSIDHRSVQRLLASGATIIDVLPDEEYENEHIAGAIHLHLRKLDGSTTAHLGKHDPVIVYCWDMQ